MDSGPQEFLVVILADVPQPVWVVDHACDIVFGNPAALSVLGYDDLGQLLGKPSHDTVHYQRLREAATPLVRPGR